MHVDEVANLHACAVHMLVHASRFAMTTPGMSLALFYDSRGFIIVRLLAAFAIKHGKGPSCFHFFPTYTEDHDTYAFLRGWLMVAHACFASAANRACKH